MKTINFQKGLAYKIDDKTAFYLGTVDGINTFSLKFDCVLHLFYFEKNKIDKISSIDKNKIEMYKEEQLSETISFIEGKKIEINNPELLKFIFMAKPSFPNSAFCESGKLEELFFRKGIVYNEESKIELGKKYRAVHPSYCVLKNDVIFRQTDMWEKYPDLVLKYISFDKTVFFEKAEFKDFEEIYLTALSSESYGGIHKDFDAMKQKCECGFDEFFKNCKMAEFKRVFAVKEEKKEYFKSLGIDENKILLLKKSV